MRGFLQKLLKQKGVILFCQKGRAHGGEQVGIGDLDDMLLIQMKLTDKGGLQLGQKVKRTSEKCDVSADRLSLSKAGDGLNDHGLKNGGGKIFLAGSVIDERLNVGFGKNSAPRGDRIEGFIAFGVLIEPGSICLQKGSHLVDKGPGSSGTGSVHALLHIAVFKINDLGILAAKLNGNVCQGGKSFDCGGLCHHLLYERNAEVIGKRKTAGAGDHRMDPYISGFCKNLFQNVMESFTDLSVMAAVVAEHEVPVAVEKGSLDGGRSDINAEGIVF